MAIHKDIEINYNDFKIVVEEDDILSVFIPPYSKEPVRTFPKVFIEKALSFIKSFNIEITKDMKLNILNKISLKPEIYEDENERLHIESIAKTVYEDKNIINYILACMGEHIGEEYLKKLFTFAILSLGIKNVEIPLHMHLYGDPESGKTDLTYRFMNIIPKENKVDSDDFSDRALMYEKIKEGSIITINDKILNDGFAKLLNQLCDTKCWYQGHVATVTVEHNNVKLKFPPRTLVFLNTNKKLSEYKLEEVDPHAVEQRFMSFEKYYTPEQKSEIFIKKTKMDLTEPIKVATSIIRRYIREPVEIKTSEEIRRIVDIETNKLGIISLRQKGQFLTVCQVFALIEQRKQVEQEDIDNTLEIYKNQKSVNTETNVIAEKIYKFLPTEKEMMGWEPDLKVMFNKTSIRNGLKIQYTDCDSAIEYLIKIGKVDFVWTKARNNKNTTCYFKKGTEKINENFEQKLCTNCNKTIFTKDKDLCQECLNKINEKPELIIKCISKPESVIKFIPKPDPKVNCRVCGKEDYRNHMGFDVGKYEDKDAICSECRVKESKVI